MVRRVPTMLPLALLLLLLVAGGAPWLASSAEAAATVLRPSPRPAKGEQGAPIGNISLSPTLYPAVRRDEDLVETLHGVEVRDPYRWLEDPDSDETRKFVSEQNKLSRSVLDATPARAPFREALDRGLDFPKFGSPSLRGGRYYYSYNPGLANQASLFSVPSLDTPHSEATLLIDPNTLSKDGTVALFDASFSEDGRHVSYQLSSGGSDWRTVKVMRLDPETGKGTPLPGDDLQFVKFSSEVWSKDNLGFFYSRYPPPPAASSSSGSTNGTDLGTETDSATGQQLWYHVVGTPQASDALVLSVPEHPDWSIGASVDDSGDTLYVSISQGTSPANRLWAVDLAAVPRKAAKEGEEKGPLDFAALDKEGSGSGTKNGGPSPNLPLAKLVDDFDASYDYLATRSLDGKDVFMTNAGAPLYRLVVGDARSAVVARVGGGQNNNKNGGKKSSAASSAAAPAFTPIRDWPDLVPQHPKDTLQFAKAMKGDEALVLGYLEDVATVLKHGSLIDGLGGKGKGGGNNNNGTAVPLPPLGSVGDLSGDRQDSVLFFTYTSFVDPGTTYSYDTASVAAAREEKRKQSSSSSSKATTATTTAKSAVDGGGEKTSSSSSSSETTAELAVAAAAAAPETSSSSAAAAALKVFRQTQVPDYNRADYKTERVFATSKDGTKVPIFVTRLANASMDGRRPTVLYGYGGFNIAVKPSFSVSRMLWIRSFNAAYASANMRGGGEYGISWRDAGSGAFKKQKVFDDFEAAAEHLISKMNLTSPPRLAAQGASNGGTLVAACVNQRPDLFAAALPTVGVHDMARFDRFTIGHAWRSDFGDPRDSEQFKAIMKWSPLHNVAVPAGGTRNYPALLIMTGDHDDRVPPLHSLKYGATVQHAVAQDPTPERSPQRNPVLLRVETRAGHGAGKPTAKQIEELSDIYGFLADVMGARFGEEN